MQIVLNLQGHRLLAGIRQTLSSGSKEVDEIKLEVDETWKGFGKIAVFCVEKKCQYTVVDETTQTAKIPAEILKNEAVITIGMVGFKDEAVMTSTLVAYQVEKGSVVTIEDPEPSIYAEILSRYADLATRLNNIIANAGDLTNNAELIDARVGADGVVYDTLGEAVRTQAENNDRSIKSISNGYGFVLSKTATANPTGVTELRSFDTDLSEYAGKEVMFEIICDSEICPNGLSFLTFNGVNIEGKSQATKYLPNTKYVVVLDSSFAEATKSHAYGPYGSNGDVKAEGNVECKLYPEYGKGSAKNAENIAKNAENIAKNTDGIATLTNIMDVDMILSKTATANPTGVTELRSFDTDLSEYAGKEVMFEIICDSEICPNGLSFLTFNGVNIEGKSQATKYLPNTKYVVVLDSSFAEATKSHAYGPYGSNGDVKAEGTISCYIYIGENALPFLVSKNKEDIKKLKEENNNNRTLVGKTLWTLGDSLCHNTWQSYFKDITGCEWDADLNILSTKPISWGGTNSHAYADDGTQARARNLASYKDSKPIDIIIIENVNDHNENNNYGDITDPAFMRSQKISFDTGKTSYGEANSYVEEHLLSYISGIESSKRLKATILDFIFSNGTDITGSKIQFLTSATAAGTVTITWDGKPFSVEVSPGMSPSDIAAAFSMYSFGAGVGDTVTGDTLVINYYTITDKRATFSGGNTGVTALVSDATGIGHIFEYFYGSSASEWENTEKWSRTCTLYSSYKGLLEYLTTEFPEANICWMTPWTASVDFSGDEYKNSDGSWSNDKFTFPFEGLFEIQKNVCDLFNIPVLELDKKSGMNIMNIETYFNSNNVHPKQIGYQKYANTMANMIGKLY